MAETGAPEDASVPAGKPAPDFSALALEHLEQRCDAFRQHVREHLERPLVKAPLAELTDDLHRFRNTLVLLERTGAVFVAEELLALLAARGAGTLEDEDEFARVMVAAGERLGDHVARLALGARGQIGGAGPGPDGSRVGGGGPGGDPLGESGLQTGGEGALALLPLVNDSRACRDAPLLSEALILAAGIVVPTGPDDDEHDRPEAVHGDAGSDERIGGDDDAAFGIAAGRATRERFLQAVRSQRPTLLPALRDWFRAVPGAAPAAATADVLVAVDAIARVCDAPALDHLAPTFASAAVLAAAVRDGIVADGTAPRRLFAQLERWLHAVADADGRSVPTPPAQLQRNLLYYVALVEPVAPNVVALHRRFGLSRIRPALAAAARDESGGALGSRLSSAIRDSLDVETSGLRQWLEQAPTAADHPHVARLRARLSHLEPVLTLLGAREARRWLGRINETLDTLSGDEPVGAADRLMLAESLIRLDRALDAADRPGGGPQDVGGSVSADGLEPPPSVETEGAVEDADDPDTARRLAVEVAVAACLSEARRRLLLVGESLDAPRLVAASGGDAQLETIERAVSVLALPDVLPLLRGLRAANVRIAADAPRVQRETLATLIASLDFYLGCVLHADPTRSSRLLRDAEEALSRLEGRLSSPSRASSAQRRAPIALPGAASLAARGSRESALAPAGETGEDGGETRREVGREGGQEDKREDGREDGREESRKDRRGDAGAARKRGQRVEPTSDALAHMYRIGDALACPGGVTVAALRDSFDGLAAIGRRGGMDGMRELADATLSLLDRVASSQGGDGATVPPIEHARLEEAHAALPQLIEQVHGSSERVRGLDTLVRTLRDTLEPGALDDSDTLERAGLDDSDSATLDDTLQEVFRRECAAHIDTLEQAVARAESRPGTAERMPSEAMLRALHTLGGSAQTVDSRDIVAIVQPLQRVALARHRSDVPLDAAETRYVGELVGVLKARLRALQGGVPVDEGVVDVESRLDAFVEDALAARHGESAFDARSLDDVFDEEARELLTRLKQTLSTESDADAAIDRALGHLHTLKGSARMAGRDALAERAHALEGLVQGMPARAARRRALLTGRRELQTLLLDTAPLTSGPLPVEATGGAPSAAAATYGTGHGADDGVARQGVAASARSRVEGLDGPSGETAPLSAATFDSLLTLATDVTVSQARLSDDIARVREISRDLESAAGRWRRLPHEAPLLESPAAREMLADLDTARRGLSDALRLADVEQQHASRAASSLQQTLIRTRLVRVDDLFPRLAEAVADAAEATGRDARVVIDGGDITLDGALCRQLRAPLEHLVRNAVVHGIELPSARREAGKAVCGTVRLQATIDGTEIVLAVEDDGAGIDRDAVSRRREAAGRQAVGTVDALQDVLCEAGFTTLDAASAVGGRGLGLSAVSETLARLDGRLHIGTRAGEGTVVTCRLRQPIIVHQVVLLRCARRLYALPVNVVRRVGADETGGSDARAGRPGAPERHSLQSLLGGVAPPHGRDDGETDDTGAYGGDVAELSVEVNGRAFVLEVDRVLGYRELLTQPLGPQIAALRCYAGGSVLPDGRQVLVIELDRLVGERGPAAGGEARRARPDPESMRPIALIVDDSITMRVAAASMLAAHGVEAREARDGIEALSSLERALPDVMIVDLDMPRLGGFDLIRRARERFGDDAPPVIVITSREGAEDRDHARTLGAVRYLTKPYTEEALHDGLIASGLRLPDLTIA